MEIISQGIQENNMAIYRSLSGSSTSSVNTESSYSSFYDPKIKSDYDIVGSLPDEVQQYNDTILNYTNKGFYYDKLYNRDIITSINSRQKIKIISDVTHFDFYTHMPLVSEVPKFFVSESKDKENTSLSINDMKNPHLTLFHGYPYEFVIPYDIYQKYSFDIFLSESNKQSILQDINPKNSYQQSDTIKVIVKKTSLGNKYVFSGIDCNVLHLESGRTYIFDISDPSNIGHDFYFSYNIERGGDESLDGRISNFGISGNDGGKTTIDTSALPDLTVLFMFCKHHPNMGDNVQILIHDITSSNLKFENNLVVMRIVPNKNISKCVYGNLIGRFIGNSIDFINLNNYIFTPFIDHGLFLGYFKFKYINNSWRAFFPTTLKFKVQNKSENNISAGRGSGTCFFVDSLESPNIIISSDTTYKIINESVATYPVYFYKGKDNFEVIGKKDGAFIIDNQKNGDPNIFMHINSFLIDPYAINDDKDPYSITDPYYSPISLNEFFYNSIFKLMGAKITVDSNGISLHNAFENFRHYNRYPFEFEFPYSGNYAIFHRGMECFDQYFSVQSFKDNPINKINVNTYSILDFTDKNNESRNRFNPLSSLRPDSYFVLEFGAKIIDDLIVNDIVSNELINIFGSFSENTYNVVLFYKNRLKELVKDIAVFYRNSLLSVNSYLESFDKNIFDKRLQFITSVPQVENISGYVSDDKSLSIIKDLGVSTYINISESFESYDKKIFYLDKSLYEIGDCNNLSVSIDKRDIAFVNMIDYSPMSNKYIYSISDMESYKFSAINKISKFNRVLVGPIIPNNVEGFKESRNSLYQSAAIKSTIKSFSYSINSINSLDEKIIMIYDIDYQNKIEIERLFLFYKQLGFNSVCIRLVSSSSYNNIAMSKEICIRFGLSHYVYIDKFSILSNIEQACSYMYLGDSDRKDLSSLLYKKIINIGVNPDYKIIQNITPTPAPTPTPTPTPYYGY